MSKMFVTSDLHFFHQNIIRYCDRPWETVEEMNEGLIDNWNKVVTPEDKVIFLGDLTFYSDTASKELTKRLNGKKILFCGNHDTAKAGYYYNCGFERILDWVATPHFVLAHNPDTVIKKEELGWRWFLYGHTHEKLSEMWGNDPRAINTCLDYNGWFPLEINKIINNPPELTMATSCEELETLFH